MRLYLIAGEPSGDKLGAALMAGLKELAPEVVFFGVGGPLMQTEGLESLFPMEELSVMGIAEVLPKLRELFARRDEVAADILTRDPAALITIDSPDFCLRVAKKVKQSRDIPVIHYVAPSVWAWRAGRAKKMARVVDHVLALLPFEPPLMEAAGLGCDFVGHPVVSEPVATDADCAAFRERHGIGDAPLLLALPGSRRGEVARLGPRFGVALERCVSQLKDARVVVPMTGPVSQMVTEMASSWSGAPILLDPRETTNAAFLAEKRAAFGAADVALAASGTVSLELAASGTPMVIAYDMNWFSRQMIGLLLQIDTVTLVNLVTDTRVIPEFLGAACQPEPIAEALLNLMKNDAAREEQEAAFATALERLGKGREAPGTRAARAVLRVTRWQ